MIPLLGGRICNGSAFFFISTILLFSLSKNSSAVFLFSTECNAFFAFLPDFIVMKYMLNMHGYLNKGFLKIVLDSIVSCKFLCIKLKLPSHTGFKLFSSTASRYIYVNYNHISYMCSWVDGCSQKGSLWKSYVLIPYRVFDKR